MSADYWVSSQRAKWQFTKEQLTSLRFNIMMWEKQKITNNALLIRYDTNMRIFIHQMIARLGRRLSLRQIILSTAEVYITRFLTKVSLLEINIYMLVATSVYVSCKICESPQHIRTILSEARNCWPEFISGDFTKLAEFEFYLIEELECYLIIHHPYYSLKQLVQVLGKSSDNNLNSNNNDNNTNNNDNVDTNSDSIENDKNNDSNNNNNTNNNNNVLNENFKYKINLTDNEIENAWHIINDSYMTDLPLLYPPHIIAIASLHLVLVLNIEANNDSIIDNDIDKKNLKNNNTNNINNNINNSDPLLSFILDSNTKNSGNNHINNNEEINSRNINDKKLNNNKVMNNKNVLNNKTGNKITNNNTSNNISTINKNIMNNKNINNGSNHTGMNSNVNYNQGNFGLRRKLSQSLSYSNRSSSNKNSYSMSLSPEKPGFFNNSITTKNNNCNLNNNNKSHKRIEEFTNFLAGSNVNLIEVIESIQEMLNLYEAWHFYDEGAIRQNIKIVLMSLHTRSGGVHTGVSNLSGLGIGNDHKI